MNQDRRQGLENKAEEFILFIHRKWSKFLYPRMEHALGYYKKTKSTNLSIKGKKLEGKGIENTFNKIIKENFLTLEKEMPSKPRGPQSKNRKEQKRDSPWHIILRH